MRPHTMTGIGSGMGLPATMAASAKRVMANVEKERMLRQVLCGENSLVKGVRHKQQKYAPFYTHAPLNSKIVHHPSVIYQVQLI
jgi:hypothetical protein